MFDNDVYDFGLSIYQNLPPEQQDPANWPCQEPEGQSGFERLVDYFDRGGSRDYDGDGDIDLHDLADQLRAEAQHYSGTLTPAEVQRMNQDAALYDWLGGLADQVQGDTNQPRGGGGPPEDDGGIN